MKNYLPKLNSATNSLVILSSQGILMDWDQQFARKLNSWSLDSKPLSDLLDLATKSKWRKRISDLQNGIPQKIKLAFIDVDGRKLYARGRFTFVHNKGGGMIVGKLKFKENGVSPLPGDLDSERAAFFRQHAGRRTMAPAIRRSEGHKFEEMFVAQIPKDRMGGSAMGMLMIDEGGRIECCNGNMVDIAGQETEDLVGLNAEELIPGILGLCASYRGSSAGLGQDHPKIFTSKVRGKRGNEIEVAVNVKLIETVVGERFLAGIKELRKVGTLSESDLYSAYYEGGKQERDRIGNELHDSIGQMLGAIHLNLVSLESKSSNFENHRQTLVNICKTAILECRRISQNLVSQHIENKGLEEILKDLVESCYPCMKDVLKMECVGIDFRLGNRLKQDIYRICQELLNNAVKYAQASEIKLILRRRPDSKIEIYYRDNGVGFDPSKVRKGIGMGSLRNRVQRNNGSLRLNTENGTTFRILLPIALDKQGEMPLQSTSIFDELVV